MAHTRTNLLILLMVLCGLNIVDSAPYNYIIDQDILNDTNCMCFETNAFIETYVNAFLNLKQMTHKFVNHTVGTKFNDYTFVKILNKLTYHKNNHKNFINKYTEIYNIMKHSINNLKPGLNEMAEHDDFYKWMLVITGYTLMREYDELGSLNYMYSSREL